MPDVLIYGDTMRTPELRHEVPVPIPDPFLYAEKGDRRIAILHSLEIPRVRQDAPALEIIHPLTHGHGPWVSRTMSGAGISLHAPTFRNV